MQKKENDIQNYNFPIKGLAGMTERLLQFIWQFQYYNKSELDTQMGEKVQIINAGTYNTNQGPDFLNAKIKIDDTILAGSIELHINTSDWKKHNHQKDKNYSNVILHVVWQDDSKASDIPVLELKTRIAKVLLERYEELMNTASFIPCEKSIHTVKEISWLSWKERLLVERLLRKSKQVEQFLNENNYHWEETFWWMIARNFGIKINADAFEAMAKTISTNTLAKHKNQIHQLEALLFGQCGMLERDFAEHYPQLLKKEYQFLKTKYVLEPIHIPVHYLRMRPAAFPTIRLAQLAILIQNSVHLFSKIKEIEKLTDIKKLLDVTGNDYWHYHYRFDEETAFKKKKLGNSMTDNIIINTVVPVLFAYSNYHKENKYKKKALQWLEELSAEKNTITSGFEQLSIQNKNAYDSQALIELKNEYCKKKLCLECGVGNVILKEK